MNTKYGMLLISVSIAFLQLGAQAAGTAADALKTAQKEFQAKRYDAAQAAFAWALAAPDAEAGVKVAAHIGIANILLQGASPKVPAAIAEYDKALALSDLAAKDRINLLTLAARAHECLPIPDRDGALALHARIVADPAAGNSAKIAALNSMAGIHLDKGNLQTANTTIEQALALPDLKSAEQLAALRNAGEWRVRQADYPAARAIYQKMLGVDTTDRNKDAVDKLMTASWIAEGNFEKAAEINRRDGRALELAEVYQQKGDLDAARAELRKGLADPKANDKNKPAVLTQLLRMSIQCVDHAAAKQDAESFLPNLMATNANQAAILLPLLKDAMEKGNYPCVTWAVPIVMQAQTLSDRDFLLCRVYLVNALGAQGKADEARKVAGIAATDDRLSITNRLRFTLTAAALASTGKAGEMKEAYGRALTTFKADGVSSQARADAILQAGKSALLAGKEAAARECYQLHQAMFVRQARASCACEYMDKAPSDVGGWLASPLLKDPRRQARLNRPYGSNLAFLLETDAATASRGVVAGSAEEGDTETDFHVACDANGLHFFFLAADSKVSEVNSGLLSGGSYEGYLAPGPDQPYYTFLVNLPSGLLTDGFSTMYPNRHFRQARKMDDSLASSTQPTGKGFATYVFYSWELFYDRLPQNGDAWRFDNIRWTRAGGFSWAGSESVHNPSSWGDIVFQGLTAKNLSDIKRKILFKAFARYKLERNAKARGAIDFWQDLELGDPDFYKVCLAPIVARLDDYGSKVTRDMTDSDVDLLFEEAVPDWMEFKFKVAELRRDYLENQKFLSTASRAAKPQARDQQ